MDLTLVPLELRTLVSFFDTDDRATAILWPTDDHGERRILFENDAFKSLTLDRSALAALLQAFPIAPTHGARRPQEVHHDARRWQWRCLDESITVLTSTATSPQPDEPRPRDVAPVRTLSESREVVKAVPPAKAPSSLDWTRSAIPRLSPWVEYVRTFDWASTPLGPMSSWSAQLRQAVLFIMKNPQPRLLLWGPEIVYIYNAACIPVFGRKHHPECLGKPAQESFAEIWDDVGGLIAEGFKGNVQILHNMLLTMERNGYVEECYIKFMLLPILSGAEDSGNEVEGLLDELTDMTAVVRSSRRRTSILKFSETIAGASTLSELWDLSLRGLRTSVEDCPYALLYKVVDDPDNILADGANSKACVYSGVLGIAATTEGILPTFSLTSDDKGQGISGACIRAWRSGQTVTLNEADGSLPAAFCVASPGRGFDDVVRKGIVLPITSNLSTDIHAILVIGLNPRCALDEEYRMWTTIVTDCMSKSASFILLPEEQRRAQKAAQDINERLSQQLRTTTLLAERSEANFARMAASAPTGMYLFDATGRAIYVNDKYLEMIGQTQEEHAARESVLSGGWQNAIHPEDLPGFHAAWTTLLQQKAPVTVEYRLRQPWTFRDTATGRETTGEKWVSASAFPEIDEDGEVQTVQGWLTDISHRKFSDKLIGRQLEEALENKRSTERFIDMTSHEIRNPLSATLQSADAILSTLHSAGMPILDESLIIDNELTEEIMDSVQTIILCAQHQKRIVDDILTLSKLDASLLEISPDQVQPPNILYKALKMFDAEITRANITTTVCVEESYREMGIDWVILDSSRLLQVVINLLTNSIKFVSYCDVRQITMHVGASTEKPTGKHHALSFIPRAKGRPAVPTRTIGEDDIYLQIAVTDSGQGLTEEEMRILFKRFSQASPKTYSQYGGSGLGLFISREVTELLGGQIGVSSTKGETTFAFFVAAKKIQPSDHDGSRTSSFTNTIGAPGVPSGRHANTDLIEVAERLKSKNISVEGSPSIVSVPPPAKLHILLVEDNLINQKVASQQLRKAGCVVEIANHGEEALAFLEKTTYCAQAAPLSVVLLDIEMPVMDGLTCIRAIRQRQSEGQITGHVPVIAVTANARSEQKAGAVEAGMDAVITKPFRIKELIPQIEALVTSLATGRSSSG